MINLGIEENKMEVKVDTSLKGEVKKRSIERLHEYANVFAWSYQDMSGLDTDIVVHKLPLKPGCLPVKQNLRRTRPNMSLKIKEEFRKHLDVGSRRRMVRSECVWIIGI